MYAYSFYIAVLLRGFNLFVAVQRTPSGRRKLLGGKERVPSSNNIPTAFVNSAGSTEKVSGNLGRELLISHCF